MTEILILLAILYACAYATAYFSWMLDNWFDEGMIFQGWIPFLQDTIGEKSFWYKPLGGCVKCANVWHSIGTFCLTIGTLLLIVNVPYWAIVFLTIPLLIAYIAVSNGILRKKLLNE